MSHEINERDSQTGVEMAWHGLTNIVECVTRENSGICYPMTTQPLFCQVENETIKTPFKQVVALDDNLPIGWPVSEDYGLITNSQGWDVVEKSLAGTDHKIISAGTVCDRSIVFVSVKLDEGFRAAGRLTKANLNFCWGHGGKLSFISRTSTVTVVCYNTFVASLEGRSEFEVKIRHTRNAVAYIEDLPKLIDAHFGVRAEFARAMDSLAEIPCQEAEARQLFAGLITPKDKESLSHRTLNTVNRLVDLFATGKGNDGDDMADVFNAVTDYYSHESIRSNPWRQFVSSEFGAGQAVKARAYTALTSADGRKELSERGEVVLASALSPH